MRLRRVLTVGVVLLLLVAIQTKPVEAQEPVAYGVLFYSPTCPHCHQVIAQDLPPLLEQYGEQLRIIGIDTSQADGNALYRAAIERFNIPPERQGVPMLIIGETVLVGSLEIPEQLPGLVEYQLSQGGVGWPDIPGLADTLLSMQSEPTLTPEATDTATSTAPAELADTNSSDELPAPPAQNQEALADLPTLSETTLSESPFSRFRHDPVGNTFAVIVLSIMILAIGILIIRSMKSQKRKFLSKISLNGWVTPVLAIIGLGVAVYLAYVETTQTTAVCGPIGDCNTVQQSKYALLFGFLPIGILGAVGYIMILATWLGLRIGSDQIRSWSSVALFGMTVFGTLFSMYLTFLEPFVIGATCAWCLTSAAIMTVLLVLATPIGIAELQKPVVLKNSST